MRSVEVRELTALLQTLLPKDLCGLVAQFQCVFENPTSSNNKCLKLLSSCLPEIPEDVSFLDLWDCPRTNFCLISLVHNIVSDDALTYRIKRINLAAQHLGSLRDVSEISRLIWTMPNLQHLDLDYNDFTQMSFACLREAWRNSANRPRISLRKNARELSEYELIPVTVGGANFDGDETNLFA